jgi:hypothetical protein
VKLEAIECMTVPPFQINGRATNWTHHHAAGRPADYSFHARIGRFHYRDRLIDFTGHHLKPGGTLRLAVQLVWEVDAPQEALTPMVPYPLGHRIYVEGAFFIGY